MKKTVFLTIMIVLSMALLFACGSKKEEVDPKEITDDVLSAADSACIAVGNSTDKAIQAYAEAKAKAEKKRRDKKKEKEGDPEDPANADSTAAYGSKRTQEQMKSEFIGKWELQGVLINSGDLDPTTGATGKYVIKADGTYTSSGTDANGNSMKGKGRWILNENNQLVAGDDTLGIDESGYLLRDTGERDGKGRKMKYAYAKV